MSRLYLVRHGRATAGWDVDPDPGIDDLGRSQAAAVAERLAPLGPMPILSSPLRRCRETSEPLAAAWGGRAVSIEPRVTEIPSPEGIPMDQRVEWLRAAMQGTWGDLGLRYTAFRDAIAAALRSPDVDAVIFSHFIAINAVIGVATGDDRLVIRSLDNCSVTIVDVDADGIRLVEAGHEADTLIR
jgi:broad specificity phosphatase PhoE